MNEYLSQYFNNYEIIKLEIFHPDYINISIILLFIIVAMVTIKRDEFKVNGNRLLSVSHTDQLRGFAIFFVVLGHLWVHVSKTRAQIILSSDSVALFLLLSGFGLAISTRKKNIGFKEYFINRIKRVMLPYWLITIFIIILDYLILARTLRFDNLLITIFGINISAELCHLDYVRWFVTFILLWYLLFYTIYLKFKFKYSSALLLLAAFVMLPLDYYYFHFEWYQFLSFPTGCLLAVHYEKIIDIFNKNRSTFVILSIVGISYVLIYKIFMSYGNHNFMVHEFIPNIILSYISEGNSLIFSLSCIVLIGQLVERGLSSNILLFLGKYSYDIFLLHGVFLIKYDPIITGKSYLLVIIQFTLFVIIVTGISVLSHKMHNKLYAIKN